MSELKFYIFFFSFPLARFSARLANLYGVLSAILPGMKVLIVEITRKGTSYYGTGPMRLNMGKEMPRNVLDVR